MIDTIVGALMLIVTSIYVIVTIYLFLETKKLRLLQTRPKVAVYVEPSKIHINLIELVVRNDGNGPARDITFEVVPSENCNKNCLEILKEIKSLGFVKKGIAYLSPGQEIRSYLINLCKKENIIYSTQFFTKVKYTDIDKNEKFSDQHSIDFGMLEGLKVLGDDPLTSMSNNLKDINNVMNNMRSYLSTIADSCSMLSRNFKF